MEYSEMALSCKGMKKHSEVSDMILEFGKEKEFRPHIRHVDPVLTECDLDWKSHLRFIPEPRYNYPPFPHSKDNMFPTERKLMRSFPEANMVSCSEWSFYPNFGQPKIYHKGKRCFIDGMHHTRSMRCFSERPLEMFIGRKKKVTTRCFNSQSGKERSFLVPEYSHNFHKQETPQNTTNERLSSGPCVEKQKKLAQEEDIFQVKKLNSWRPAPDIYTRTKLFEMSFIRS